MLRWVEDYFARRATRRQLAKYIAPEVGEQLLSGIFEPPKSEIRKAQFILALVSGETPEILRNNMETLYRTAREYKWIMPHSMAGLVQLQNPVFPNHESETPAHVLAAALAERLTSHARILYSEETFIIGNLEMAGVHYQSSLWHRFPDALKELCSLRDGVCKEFKQK